MRTIRVKNASILAKFGRHQLDFEIRTTKDSAGGFGIFINGETWLDVDLTKDGTLKINNIKKEV